MLWGQQGKWSSMQSGSVDQFWTEERPLLFPQEDVEWYEH